MAVSDKMPTSIDVYDLFEAVIEQDAKKLRFFFEPDATVVWANTNEEFTVDEYIHVNCKYPGNWNGRIEDIQCCSRFHDYNRITVVARVWDQDGHVFRVISFIELGDTEDELIQTMVEYWGDICEPPEWRRELGIGRQYENEF